MGKPSMQRVTHPRYTPFQKLRHDRMVARLERWRLEHQEPHELRLRALLKPQLDAWR